MEFRIARSDDAEALSVVARATFLQTFAHMIPAGDILQRGRQDDSPEAFQNALATGHALWLATIVQTGAPVGFAMLSPPDLPDVPTGPSDLELKRIYLLHRFHGEGLGLRLLNAVEAEARTRGAKRLLLGVYAENPVIGWYGRQGFEMIGERRFQVGQSVFRDLILGKTL